jgi:acetamidase/formamidase
VDAGGTDPKGVRRSGGGNPETGPFFIEGAFPGDTLVVKLNKVRLNRDSAGSGDSIVDSALASGYIRNNKYKDDYDSNWVIDADKGIARLKNPSEHLKNYTVKLQPMMGCIAVAPPAHQAMRTGFLGSYGGNMDYNQMREGTTLYLPVYAPGALLFIGDGHAAQGDGELTGDALETSMNVEFTVNLIKGMSTEGPRGKRRIPDGHGDRQFARRRFADRDHATVELAATRLQAGAQRSGHCAGHGHALRHRRGGGSAGAHCG